MILTLTREYLKGIANDEKTMKGTGEKLSSKVMKPFAMILVKTFLLPGRSCMLRFEHPKNNGTSSLC